MQAAGQRTSLVSSTAEEQHMLQGQWMQALTPPLHAQQQASFSSPGKRSPSNPEGLQSSSIIRSASRCQASSKQRS
jgi:hypothetical protein